MDYLSEIKIFKDALIKSDIGDQISKIIWFGSTKKNEAYKDSDIDILIVTTNGEAIKDRIADILLEFQMRNRTPIEVIISSIDEIYPVIDPFLKNILSYGQEIYSMSEKNLKLSMAGHYLYLAQEFYDSAEDSIKRAHYRLGLDGAYNAAELAVKGFLVMKISDIPGSHGGIAQRFGEPYIKPGIIEREIGRRLNRSLELRNSAHYKFTTKISKEDANLVLHLAKDIINLLKKKLSKSSL